jgi:hypothetical protein
MFFMMKSTSIILGLLLVSTVAGAQVATGRNGPAKSSAGSKRGIQQEPKAEPVAVVVDRPRNSNVMPTPHSRPTPVKLIPAMLLSDGSVVADFGFGMEPVRHQCAGVSVSSGGRVLGGNGQVLSQPAPHLQPVPLMQPVPRLQSPPGMQPAPSQSANQRPLSRAAAASCFTRDVNGKVFATQ